MSVNTHTPTRTFAPQLSIAGRWLAEAGFETGQAVTLRVEAGCLTLTAGG
ncbi:SymE family type I addiction module toxin [Pantoea cypripedii]|uniref:Toxin SymE-like domain-containing protein n=1 Tax=Pantoea cypripedii TaxID=55209 RepID=A0A6B9G7G6_PANCY|nr:SymE family type I addiction module toxin [Pantoea cypripedii]QGY31190.1 hypothetical protein CUN67_00045 [Pantoea cypripedii]